jgi:hypothetical protein
MYKLLVLSSCSIDWRHRSVGDARGAGADAAHCCTAAAALSAEHMDAQAFEPIDTSMEWSELHDTRHLKSGFTAEVRVQSVFNKSFILILILKIINCL